MQHWDTKYDSRHLTKQHNFCRERSLPGVRWGTPVVICESIVASEELVASNAVQLVFNQSGSF
jgi:hypothetical protein